MARNNVVGAGHHGPARKSSPGPIDMVHLEQQSLGDPGLQEEVLRLYSQMSGVYLTRIEESSSSEELARHLHTLKSAAAGIGAWQVRDLAKHAEDALREGHPVNPEHIEAIAEAVGACRAFIHSFVEAPGAAG
ncbi:Hpt domain-containing protein [Devosia sp. CN2-171]|uniref:Hpt domain-containing protein n=1 Tax=Devosia sp. CN2-171 TaxID=3400909 RepID=UPI003BF7987C